MPRKKLIRAQAQETKSVPKAKPASKRVGGVRNLILGLLAKGPLTRAEILKRGKFSDAALYLHMKSLRADGLVVVDSTNRKVGLSPVGMAAEDVVIVDNVAAPAKKAAVETSALPVHVPRALHEALDAVLFRLLPIEHASEKIMVLEQLARTTPKPIAELLRSLIEDVLRLSALKSGS